MANDLFEKFTVGGLSNGKGRGAALHALHGEITSFASAAGSVRWKVTPDNQVSVLHYGGLPPAPDPGLHMFQGCGIIELNFYDPDGTGTGNEGGVAELGFHLGQQTDPGAGTDNVESGHVHVLGGWAVGGFDISGGTVGLASVDMIAPLTLKRVNSNEIVFDVGAPYEPESGTQVSINSATILKFSVIVVTAPDGLISRDSWRGLH